MKTIEQWLNELESTYREQALRNYDREKIRAISITDALNNAFYWAHSEQGFGYWYELYNKLDD